MAEQNPTASKTPITSVQPKNQETSLPGLLHSPVYLQVMRSGAFF